MGFSESICLFLEGYKTESLQAPENHAEISDFKKKIKKSESPCHKLCLMNFFFFLTIFTILPKEVSLNTSRMFTAFIWEHMNFIVLDDISVLQSNGSAWGHQCRQYS